MSRTTDDPRKASGRGTGSDTELNLAWTLVFAFWPFVRYSIAFSAVIALFAGPPGSFLLLMGLLIFLSWKVATTDTSKLR